MKMRLWVLALSFLFLLPTQVMALSCVERPSIEQAYEQYDAVIVGQVEQVTEGVGENNQLKLKVLQSFKGVETSSLKVEENATWGAIGGPSETKEQYLFFLKRTEEGWENPLCSPTMKLSEAADEIVFLKDKEISLQQDSQGANGVWVSVVFLMIIACILAILGYAIRNAKRNGR